MTMQKSSKTTGRSRSSGSRPPRPQARTVRAASANVSERVSEPGKRILDATEETMRTGMKAATEGTERMADGVTRILGMTSQHGEELARRSASGIDAATQAGSAFTQGFQEMSREMMALMQESVQRNLNALGAVSRCRSVEELFTLQGELVRDNIQQSLESVRRMAELSTRMANEATRVMAWQPEEATRRGAA
jgi:phasin family protein